MRLPSLLLAIAFFTQTANHTRASELEVPDIPPPRAPWIGLVPERGQWEIRVAESTLTKDADGGAARPMGVNRLPVAIHSTTWNTVKRDIFDFTDGSTETLFYYAGYVLVEGQTSEGKPAPVLVQQLPGTDFSTLRSSGWLGMDWLAEKYYVEPQYHRRVSQSEGSEPELCYYFRKPEGRLSRGDDWLPEMRAWIRTRDLQPVALAIGEKLFEFQVLAPPAAAPEMTHEQAAKLLELKDQNERMVRLRERNKRLRKE